MVSKKKTNPVKETVSSEYPKFHEDGIIELAEGIQSIPKSYFSKEWFENNKEKDPDTDEKMRRFLSYFGVVYEPDPDKEILISADRVKKAYKPLWDKLNKAMNGELAKAELANKS